MTRDEKSASRGVRLFVTLFLLVLLPVYWQNYGPGNFLWLSDISLFLTFFALWFSSPLLISIMMVGIFPFELVWNVDFFFQLITGSELTGLAAYMFDSDKALFLRGLSLFHIFMPAIWLWYLVKWGYDRRAFPYAIVMSWLALILSYLLTGPEESINWVYHPEKHGWTWITANQWLGLLLICFPLFVYWPAHRLLARFVRKPAGR